MHTKLRCTVKGGAIYYAIFISFMLCLFAVLILYTTQIHNQYADYFIEQDRMKDNVQSALQYVMVHPEVVPFNFKRTLDVFGDSEDSVTILKTRWGGYIIWRISATWNKESYTRYFMTGVDFRKGEPVALYLTEKDNYLSVSGNTIIKGNAYLPKLGIRKAYIEGAGFTPEKMIDGEKYTSGRKLPQPDSLFIHSLTSLLNGTLSDSISTMPYETALNKETVQNSFSNQTLMIYSKKEILIDNGLIIKGNIIVYSSKKITLQSNARLNTCLLFAPVVSVSEDFKGSIQAFASDSLLIGNKTNISYPGYLGLLNINFNNCFIKIGKNSSIEGGIFVWQKHKAIQEPYILIDSSATVTGEVFCTGNIELKGSVNGSVYCNGFRLNTSSSMYENHLLNAVINAAALPKNFAGYDASLKIKKQKLIQCLD